VEDIKIRRLEWAGHIIGMEEERIPKEGLNGNFHTTRPVGRPRTRWVDAVQRDALQLLGIRGWRRRGANRDEWRHLMRESKARKGLQRHGWMDGWTQFTYFINIATILFNCQRITFFAHRVGDTVPQLRFPVKKKGLYQLIYTESQAFRGPVLRSLTALSPNCCYVP